MGMYTAVGIIVGVLTWGAIDALVGWLLYRWSRKFTPYSKRATAVLCYFPLINIWVTFPLMAGKEVGWEDGRTAGMIFLMTFCSVFGWAIVISFWLNSRRGLHERQNPQEQPADQ
jgi:membrane protein CcdC involved in cytochrome C biogenesis